jgi:hypothetical protein
MIRNLSILCVLTLTLLVVGCGQEDPVQPAGTQGTAQVELLGQASTETTTPQFHTIYWPPSDPSAVMKLNHTTGEGSPVVILQEMQAPPGWPGVYPGFATPYGLAFDVDGTVYSLQNWFNGVQSECFSQLVKMDLSTGAVQAIGPVHGINFAGPEFDAYGNLYATGFTVGPPEGGPTYVWGDSNLYRFDKNTGEKTLIGDTGHTEWMDLDFDPQGQLWGTFGNDLYTLDTDTGASQFVTHVDGVEDNRIPGVCEEDWEYMEIMGIAFDHRGVLWATAMRGFSPCGEGELAAPFMSIDIDSGVATLVGSSILEAQSHGGDIPPSKVKVCHLKGNGTYVSIEVSLDALPAHLEHGDVLPGSADGCQRNRASGNNRTD